MLRESQTIAKTVAAKQELAKSLEYKHELLRVGYVPAARHGRVLYFVLCDMDWINSMYRFSISWFSNTFRAAVKAAERKKDVDERVELYVNCQLVFRRVSPTLAQFDRLSFALCVCIRFLEEKQSHDFLTSEEIKFLVTHHDTISDSSGKTTPRGTINLVAPEWLHYEQWSLLHTLARSSSFFHEMIQHVVENPIQWERYHSTADIINANVPGYPGINMWQKLLLLKCIRPDSLIDQSHEIVRANIGPEFLSQEKLHLKRCFKYSNAATPLVFILSDYAYDPAEMLRKFAKSNKSRLNIITLQQGHEHVVEQVIIDSMKFGEWVLVENCHLLATWLNHFESLFEDIVTKHREGSYDLHENFRLWCSSEPSEHFPILILQEGVKMMVESPTAFRQNLIDSLDSFPFYDEHKVKRKKSLVEELQGPTEEEIRQEQRKSMLRRTAFGLC